VWSTSPYTISFVSENEGRLRHASAPNTIDYQLFMDGSEVNVMGLPAGMEPDGTDALGDFHPLQVQVQPFRARAGAYSDRVEVTVTAN
jgi:spore coat protein U-like protein